MTIKISWIDAQRQHRMAIRNAYLIADIDVMRDAMANQDDYGRSVLQDMIAACVDQDVDNFGLTF